MQKPQSVLTVCESRRARFHKLVISSLLLAALAVLGACSSSDDSGSSQEQSAPEEENTGLQSTPTGTLEDESANLVIPEGTNLRISYADSDYALVATPEFILQQWIGMKTCLQVDVPDGYILVERDVYPPADATHVIQLPDQTFAASALDREYDVFIQILVDDFDPEMEDRGYFFRQIIGPYMWRYNGYDDRTYDPNCAAFVVR